MKVITIGRSDENNDIVVNDDKVSRNHLQMVMDDQGNFSVLDLNSTNGTFVNGQRITGEVSLKVTDELRIGNTVLPWQSYFGKQQEQGINTPEPPQVLIPQSPTSPRRDMSNQSPKRRLIYVIIGAVALLLVGGGIVWKIYKDKHKEGGEISSEVLEQDAMNGQNDSLDDAKKKLKYEENMRKAAEEDAADSWKKWEDADAEAKKWEEAARKSQSEKDKEIARLRREKADELKKAAEKAQRDLDALNKKHQQELRDKDAEIKKANTAKEASDKALELTNRMQEELNKWNEDKAFEFCKKQNGWNCANKKEAKNVITKKFRDLDNASKEQKIKEMKGFNSKEKGGEEKKTTQKQKKTGTSSESQPASPESQPTPNN